MSGPAGPAAEVFSEMLEFAAVCRRVNHGDCFGLGGIDEIAGGMFQDETIEAVDTVLIL